MNTKSIKKYKYTSYLGFGGLLSFSYFINKDPKDLIYFAFFAFWGFYFMYKYLQKGVDERTQENMSKAHRIALKTAWLFLFLLGAIPKLLSINYDVECSETFFILGAATGLFSTVSALIISFFYFEKK